MPKEKETQDKAICTQHVLASAMPLFVAMPVAWDAGFPHPGWGPLRCTLTINTPSNLDLREVFFHKENS